MVATQCIFQIKDLTNKKLLKPIKVMFRVLSKLPTGRNLVGGTGSISRKKRSMGLSVFEFWSFSKPRMQRRSSSSLSHRRCRCDLTLDGVKYDCSIKEAAAKQILIRSYRKIQKYYLHVYIYQFR